MMARTAVSRADSMLGCGKYSRVSGVARKGLDRSEFVIGFMGLFFVNFEGQLWN
jgi:hypothetical protein